MVIDTFHLIRVLDRVDKRNARSAWDKGVKLYAHELIGNLCYWTTQGQYIETLRDAKKKVLNGAESWEEYSRGGCSLISDEEIAERLCSPSELKRRKGGLRPPREDKDWLSCQARALGQTWHIIRLALVQTAE